jgi:hypothetical protein
MRNKANQHDQYLVVGTPQEPGQSSVPRAFAVPLDLLKSRAMFLTVTPPNAPYFMLYGAGEPQQIDLEPLKIEDEHPGQAPCTPYTEYRVGETLRLKA